MYTKNINYEGEYLDLIVQDQIYGYTQCIDNLFKGRKWRVCLGCYALLKTSENDRLDCFGRCADDDCVVVVCDDDELGPKTKQRMLLMMSLLRIIER